VIQRVKKPKKPQRPTRGIRYTDEEWVLVQKAAFKAGLQVSDYIRAQTIPPTPPAPSMPDCGHATVLVVPFSRWSGRELVQCRHCARVGMVEPGASNEKIHWAT